jgi:predicted ribosome quality control (RQC) complex YloA/Tae2 family protein
MVAAPNPVMDRITPDTSTGLVRHGPLPALAPRGKVTFGIMRLPPPVFDSLVLAAIAEEIGHELLRARVAAVLQPDGHTIGLLLGTRRGREGLLCSIHPRWARCVLADMDPGPPTHPFALQVRARLVGGRLLAADVEPFERVLTLTFETLEGPLALVSEVMGRHSNLLLVEGERVAGVFKPVSPAMSRVRPIVPGRPYHPPPRTRPTPAQVTIAALGEWLAEGRPVAPTLVERLLGVSPPVAVHLALRAELDPDAAAPAETAAALYGVLRDLVEVATARAFAPVWYEDQSGQPVAYAAIPLLTYRALQARPTPSMSAAAARVVEEEARGAALADLQRSFLARIAEAVRRAERAARDVQTQMEEAGRADRWRRFGELLLAYAATVTLGADRVAVPDFDGTPVEIPLDPRRSPIANAQAFFRRHTKAAAALRALPARLRTLQEERAYLDHVGLFAAQAASPEEVRAVMQELAETGLAAERGGRAPRTPRPSRPKRPGAAAVPRTFTAPDGSRILVGRSNRENDHVTFTLAAPDDLWLHTRGLPGAHVILKTGGRTPTPAAVEAAASVAAYFSQGRGAAKVAVDVTARRHVRKPKGARPGMVTYREERTVLVEPRVPEEMAKGSAAWDR